LEYETEGNLMDYDAITDIFSNVAEVSNDKFFWVRRHSGATRSLIG
jgi:hypothetical protein